MSKEPMTVLNKQALRQTAEKAQEHGVFNMDIHSQTVLALLDELEAAEKRNAELDAREVNLPAACADDEYFIDSVFQALRYERDVERAIRAAGIGVKGE